MWLQFLSSAALGAFIGWITNVMTVRLIFRPRHPWRLGPVVLQGIIPRRRHEIAESLAKTVVQELISAPDLWAAVDTAPNREAVFGAVRRQLHARLQRLPQFPWRDMIFARVEDTVVRELGDYIDTLAHDPEWAHRLLRRVPVESLIVDRLESFEVADFERIIVGVSRRELRQIEVLGGLLGFVVGLFLPLVQALLHW